MVPPMLTVKLLWIYRSYCNSITAFACTDTAVLDAIFDAPLREGGTASEEVPHPDLERRCIGRAGNFESTAGWTVWLLLQV